MTHAVLKLDREPGNKAIVATLETNRMVRKMDVWQKQQSPYNSMVIRPVTRFKDA